MYMVDIKIVNVKTARNLEVQVAHPTIIERSHQNICIIILLPSISMQSQRQDEHLVK